MSDLEKQGLVFSSDKIPIPRDRAGILDILAAVLTKPYIQSVTLSNHGYMVVEWYRSPMDTLIDEVEEESTESVLSRAELEEITFKGSLKECLVDTYLRLMLKGYVPTFILCYSTDDFKERVGLSDFVFLPTHATTGRERYLGMQLQEAPELPEGTVVLCGSHVEGKTLNSVVYGFRVVKNG